MPDEYERLVEALKATDIPFVEYGWKNAPEGIYGTVSMDMEADSENGDDEKLDNLMEASVDVFFPLLSQRQSVVQAVEGVLRDICGSAWELNSIQHESTTNLFHYEWVCWVQDDGEAEETDAIRPEG